MTGPVLWLFVSLSVMCIFLAVGLWSVADYSRTLELRIKLLRDRLDATDNVTRSHSQWLGAINEALGVKRKDGAS